MRATTCLHATWRWCRFPSVQHTAALQCATAGLIVLHPSFACSRILSFLLHVAAYLCCCVLLQGFDFANWERGFGDFHMVPDFGSLRLASWLDKTAMILCDIHDNKTHKLVSVAPRSVLRKQIDAANGMGYPTIYAATELEYFQYENTYRECFEAGYDQKALTPTTAYMQDYHILSVSQHAQQRLNSRLH